MQEIEEADLAALVNSMTRAKILMPNERKQRREYLSAKIKEAKMSILEMIEELESLHVDEDEEVLFDIEDIEIADGQITGKFTCDLNLILDYYQSVPGHSSNTFPLIVEKTVFEQMSEIDFGAEAKPGAKVVAVDVLEGEIVAIGAVVSNNPDEMRLKVTDGYGNEETFAYDHDHYAFRYVEFFAPEESSEISSEEVAGDDDIS